MVDSQVARRAVRDEGILRMLDNALSGRTFEQGSNNRDEVRSNRIGSST